MSNKIVLLLNSSTWTIGLSVGNKIQGLLCVPDTHQVYWQSPKQPLLNVSLFYVSLCLFVDQAEPWTRCFKNLIIIIHCPLHQSVSQSSCRTATAYLDLHRCVLCVPIKTKAFHLIETHASCVPGQLLLPLPVVVLLHSSVAKKIKYLCPSVSVLSTSSSSSYRYGHKVTHRRQFVTVRIF